MCGFVRVGKARLARSARRAGNCVRWVWRVAPAEFMGVARTSLSGHRRASSVREMTRVRDRHPRASPP
eukprot:2962819-Prymnesium_polylepis.1